jgi:hypothetical protein
VEAALGKVVVDPGLSAFVSEHFLLKGASRHRPSMKGGSADSKRVFQALIRPCAKAVNRNGEAFYPKFGHLVVSCVGVFWPARSELPDIES